jgi:hypothetical protein
MSAEIEFTGTGRPARDGKRCRYCARIMVTNAFTADEAATHCTSRGCRWCSECYAGQTSVSPVRPGR